MAVAHRIYARALFDAAKDQDRLREVREDLRDFVASLRDVHELHELLRNPQVDPKTKVELLAELLGGVNELVRNFLLLVAQKGRAGQLEQIFREFEGLVAAEERVLDVELTTAFELSDEDANGILGQIERASGRKVRATRKVDPHLIAGIVLQAGSRRVDASVRGRLNALRRELMAGVR
ncbi:MAG: ATP synthase F1 subunit delta [Actinomycetota bacterium]|nr:ATP synthase F1 subunit delta [Actinomycetota bacterium]